MQTSRCRPVQLQLPHYPGRCHDFRCTPCAGDLPTQTWIRPPYPSIPPPPTHTLPSPADHATVCVRVSTAGLRARGRHLLPCHCVLLCFYFLEQKQLNERRSSSPWPATTTPSPPRLRCRMPTSRSRWWWTGPAVHPPWRTANWRS